MSPPLDLILFSIFFTCFCTHNIIQEWVWQFADDINIVQLLFQITYILSRNGKMAKALSYVIVSDTIIYQTIIITLV